MSSIDGLSTVSPKVKKTGVRFSHLTPYRSCLVAALPDFSTRRNLSSDPLGFGSRATKNNVIITFHR